MVEHSNSSERQGWVEAAGLPHIIRTLGLAIHPPKLGIALVALALTFALGGVLDLIWQAGGGISDSAIAEFSSARALGRPYEEPSGELGIFEVWRHHQTRCVQGLLTFSVSGPPQVTGTHLNMLGESGTGVSSLGHLIGMGYGMWWLLRVHPGYFVLFGVGSLLIWSWGGGAICRMAALQFANDEKITLRQAHDYAWRHLIGGFALAPCIPLIGAVVIAVLMALGGAVLRIPVLGDFLAGTAFVLAVLSGFIIAVLLIGLLVGGSLFWPAVAVEGQDAYDAFSRGLSYAFSKPWKTVLYGLIIWFFSAICWMLVNIFARLGLALTRHLVAFGTFPFGWWNRGADEDPISKMELLWPSGGPAAIHAWPQWSELTWYEHYSGFVIGIYVLLVVALIWAFLVSFYFCGSTVAYFLLRRDVDKTDLEEVFVDDEEGEDIGPSVSPPVAGNEGGDTIPAGSDQPSGPPREAPPPSGDSPPTESDS